MNLLQGEKKIKKQNTHHKTQTHNNQQQPPNCRTNHWIFILLIHVLTAFATDQINFKNNITQKQTYHYNSGGVL